MSDELRETMEMWRELRARRLSVEPSASPSRSTAERRAALGELARRAAPWLPPPHAGLIGELAAMVRQWQPSWTLDLTGSSLWKATANELAAIVQEIAAGQLDDADYRLRELFLRCIPATRRIAVDGLSARTPHRDVLVPEPVSREELATGLRNLVAWLEQQPVREDGTGGR